MSENLQTYKNYTNGQFDITKAINNAKRAGCSIITPKTINNVPTPEDYIEEYYWVNGVIASACSITLNQSRTRIDDYTFGEVGNVIVIKDANIYNRIIHGPVLGTYEKVKLVNGNIVKNLRSEYQGIIGSLICVHNHPSNGPFSYNDIINLLTYLEIGSIVVIGNTNWMYMLSKEYLDYKRYQDMAQRMSKDFVRLLGQGFSTKQAKHKLAVYFLENCNKHGLVYRKYKRRSIND